MRQSEPARARRAAAHSTATQVAPVLYRALSSVLENEYRARGERRSATLLASARRVLASEPSVELQYISMAHPRTLEELEHVGDDGALLSAAIRLGKTRLIDNVMLHPTKTTV